MSIMHAMHGLEVAGFFEKVDTGSAKRVVKRSLRNGTDV
jgi:hypothetical protein